LRERKLLPDVAGRALAVGEQLDNPPPGWVSQSREQLHWLILKHLLIFVKTYIRARDHASEALFRVTRCHRRSASAA
jgi:hypothetical protein